MNFPTPGLPIMRFVKMKIRFLPILLGSLAILFGCAKVGPDFVRPKTTVSPEWLEARDKRVKTEAPQYRAWWHVFNDPLLDRIIERAYRENLSLQVAGVRVLEARAQLGIAVGNFYPQTQQASGSITFNRSSEESSLSAFSSQAASSRRTAGQAKPQFSYWEDQLNTNVAWELDFWGKFRRAIESADAGLMAAVADYDSALVSLTADSANSYVQICILKRRLDIAKENVKTQKGSLKIAQARYQGGVTTERDVEQAKAALFNTEATVPTLEAQLRQAKNALGVLLALPPGKLEETLDSIPARIPAPPLDVAVGIPADLLRRRPDIRSAELQAAAQCAQIGVAKAELLPSFSLTGSIGLLSTNVGKASLADIFSTKALTASSIGPSFQWNFLNYGRLTNNVRVQDARFQELLVSYKNTVIKAQQEVEDSLAAFLRAQENAESLAKSASSAKHSLDLAFVQYQQGVTDFTTVLTAQQTLLTAQDSFASALGSISTNLIGIYRALGGGWEIRDHQDLLRPEVKEAMARRTNWGELLSPACYMPEGSKPESTVRLPDW